MGEHNKEQFENEPVSEAAPKIPENESGVFRITTPMDKLPEFEDFDIPKADKTISTIPAPANSETPSSMQAIIEAPTEPEPVQATTSSFNTKLLEAMAKLGYQSLFPPQKDDK